MKRALFLSLCFIGLFARAQQNYLFTHLGTKEGLASNATQGIQQDAKGFIWVATLNNLQRYDGHRFRTFTAGLNFPPGLIHAMVIDKKNRIWLHLGNTEIGYLDANDFTWHPARLNLPQHFITRHPFLYLSKDNQVIVIYENSGILGYGEKSNSFDEQYNPFTLPAGWNIITMWQDDHKNYWVGTNNGLVKYEPGNKRMSYAGHNEGRDSTIETFRDLRVVNLFYIDKQNRKWLGSWPKESGFSLMSIEPDGTVKQWQYILADALKSVYHTLFAIIETDGGTWMYGTNLLAKLDADKGKIYPLVTDMPGEYSIRYDIINQIFTDREKNLWLSTNRGLYHFNPGSQFFSSVYNRLPTSDSLYTADITAILKTSSGELLVSTWGSGIFSYDKNLNPIPSKIFSDHPGLNEGMVWSMVEDQKGNIWWGKQDGWLGNYNSITKKVSQEQPPLAGKKTIRQTVQDKEGNIWLGTQGGHIIKYDVEKKTYTLIQKSKGVIGRLYCSSRNEIWAGTDFDGLYRIDANREKLIARYSDSLPAAKRLLINGVADILEYDDSTMLFVSNGLNILNLNTGSFDYLFKGAELFNLAKDDKGRIWIGGSAKIICFSMQKKEMHYSFDERDGLENMSYNSGASLQLDNGDIVFGASHNMVRFNPGRAIGGTRNIQDIQVSGITVNEKDLPVDSVLKAGLLEVGPGNISIRAMFSTNSFQNSVDIYYMLEDMDTSWKPAPATGELNLNYLPHGHYILKAAILDERNNVISLQTIPIVIRPPFYQTWWFYILLAIGLLMGLFWLDSQRMKRKEEVHKMRTDIAEKLHNEVNDALGNINILSEMALLKADEEPEKAREFVEQIQDKSSATLTAMEDMLWAITPGNDSMEMATARMQEFLQGINNRSEVQVEMVIDERLRNIRFDMQWRYEAFMLFKESINGVLQAGVKTCKVHVGYDRPELTFILQFPNKGCDMQQLNNYFQGRKLAARLEGLHARLHVVVHKTNAEIECFIPSMLK